MFTFAPPSPNPLGLSLIEIRDNIIKSQKATVSEMAELITCDNLEETILKVAKRIQATSVARDFADQLNKDGIKAYVKEGYWESKAKLDRLDSLLKDIQPFLIMHQNELFDKKSEISTLNAMSIKNLIKRIQEEI